MLKKPTRAALTRDALEAAGKMCVAMDKAMSCLQQGKVVSANWLGLSVALSDLWAARRDYDRAIIALPRRRRRP